MKFKSVIADAERGTRKLEREIVRDEGIFDTARYELEFLCHIQHPEEQAHAELDAHMDEKKRHCDSEKARYANLKALVGYAERRRAQIDRDEAEAFAKLKARYQEARERADREIAERSKQAQNVITNFRLSDARYR